MAVIQTDEFKYFQILTTLQAFKYYLHTTFNLGI